MVKEKLTSRLPRSGTLVAAEKARALVPRQADLAEGVHMRPGRTAPRLAE